MRLSSRLSVFAVALVVGCTTDVAPLSPAQREVVAAYVSGRAPSPETQLDVRFGDAIRLLGYDVNAEEWRPGGTLRVTWYWQTHEAVGADWSLFTDIASDAPARRVAQNGNGTLRWLYGPERWKAGQFLEDTQTLRLPEDWAGDEATLHVGLEREGKRMPITSGPSDGQNRALGPTIEVVPDPAFATGSKVPLLVVVQTRRPPKLDGSLTDSVWGFARTTAVFVETRSGGVAPVTASAKLLWDKRYLYVGIDVSDALLRASDRDHDDHLWEQDCVELMIDPDGDGKNYFEIQVSPRGVVFDTRYDARRVPKPFGHTDWNSEARTAVSPRGTIDDSEADAGYTVEIAVPWHAFRSKGQPRSPPTIGDTWRANLYVMDLTRDRQHAAAWSPLGIGDFHVPARFGILAFEGPPNGAVGHNKPVSMPSNRAKQPKGREDARDLGVRDALIKKRVLSPRQSRGPRSDTANESPQRLESSEGAH